jgi:hypothetical protein
MQSPAGDLIQGGRFAEMARPRWTMKWIRERDALIAQTLAFVQSVTSRTAEIRPPEAPAAAPNPSAAIVSVRSVEITTVRAAAGTPAGPIEAEPLPAPQPQPFERAPPTLRGEVRSEMQARVANFRRHQERFAREREEYCASTLTKLRAAIRDGAASPPTGKSQV